MTLLIWSSFAPRLMRCTTFKRPNVLQTPFVCREKIKDASNKDGWEGRYKFRRQRVVPQAFEKMLCIWIFFRHALWTETTIPWTSSFGSQMHLYVMCFLLSTHRLFCQGNWWSQKMCLALRKKRWWTIFETPTVFMHKFQRWLLFIRNPEI